ncbi:MAG: hypothetical protein Q7S79_02885 [bacterium]|nr:hypothetical protein [bacterium]
MRPPFFKKTARSSSTGVFVLMSYCTTLFPRMLNRLLGPELAEGPATASSVVERPRIFNFHGWALVNYVGTFYKNYIFC